MDLYGGRQLRTRKNLRRKAGRQHKCCQPPPTDAKILRYRRVELNGADGPAPKQPGNLFATTRPKSGSRQHRSVSVSAVRVASPLHRGSLCLQGPPASFARAPGFAQLPSTLTATADPGGSPVASAVSGVRLLQRHSRNTRTHASPSVPERVPCPPLLEMSAWPLKQDVSWVDRRETCNASVMFRFWAAWRHCWGRAISSAQATESSSFLCDTGTNCRHHRNSSVNERPPPTATSKAALRLSGRGTCVLYVGCFKSAPSAEQ